MSSQKCGVRTNKSEVSKVESYSEEYSVKDDSGAYDLLDEASQMTAAKVMDVIASTTRLSWPSS